MDLLMYLLAVMTCIIALPLDKILKAVVPHVAIQDLLDLVLLITVDDRGWWWRVMLKGDIHLIPYYSIPLLYSPPSPPVHMYNLQPFAPLLMLLPGANNSNAYKLITLMSTS
jgi:hypothetical protein